MSLILEALRKSEERRRLGETPTLANESGWSARRRHPLAQRDRRPLWLLLAVLVLATPVAAWWLMRDPTPDAPVTARAQTAAAPTTRPIPVATPTPAVAPPATSVVPEAAPPVIVEQAPPPVPTVVSAPVPEATPVDLAAADAAMQQRLAENQATPVPTPAVPVEQPTTPPPVAAAPADAASLPVAVAQPEFDSVPELWQLPLPTRQALPALALTMHVYAVDPAQRFALINDKRVGEGSPLENDLDVREIRPDGVVLEFRGERFLLPRTGR